MAKILKSSGEWHPDSVLNLLLVATGDSCEKLFDQFRKTVKSKNYKILVHKCETIQDVLNFQSELSDFNVDFVVFAFDGRIPKLVKEAEEGLQLIDEFFIISGRVCLVNCYGSSGTMGLTCHSANELRENYCIRLFTANIYKYESLELLVDNILTLAETLLGVHSGVVDLNMLTTL